MTDDFLMTYNRDRAFRFTSEEAAQLAADLFVGQRGKVDRRDVSIEEAYVLADGSRYWTVSWNPDYVDVWMQNPCRLLDLLDGKVSR